MTEIWVAEDACTLRTAERPLRVAEFDELFAQHLVRVERQGPTGLSLTLRGDEGLEAQVRDLAGRETSCCSFFDFGVAVTDGQAGSVVVRLDVRVPAERADVLAALAERAASAAPAVREVNR